MSVVKKILFWGAKSQSLILQKMLIDKGEDVSFIYDGSCDSVNYKTNAVFSNLTSDLKKFIEQSTHFVVCIGGEHGQARHLISKKLKDSGLIPLTIISDHSIIDKTSNVGWGFLALPGSMLHCFSKVGDSVILNANSSIDHECILGNGVNIMPSAAIAGTVKIGNYVSVGTNATILPGLTIGDGAYIGAGAVVNRDVEEDEIVVGNPARFLMKNVQKRNDKLMLDLSYFDH